MSLLLVLIQKQATPHNKNNAINPLTKEVDGDCGITAATKNATTAILHQGKYRHAQKLRSIVKNMEMINFIFLLFSRY